MDHRPKVPAEELRRAAGVSGQSTQRVYVDSRRTLYSRIGDVFAWWLVIFTAPVCSRCSAKQPGVRSARGREESLTHCETKRASSR